MNTDKWEQVRALMPPKAHFFRVSASADSSGAWFALVELHRRYDEGGSWHLMNEMFDPLPTPEAAIEAALDSLIEQLTSNPVKE